MSTRIIAIGDIHGHAAALAAIIRLIQPKPDDTVVTLGDCVDRGPDSRGVLDQLIELQARCRLIPLLGNHEEIMLSARCSRSGYDFWTTVGGNATLNSYGPNRSMSLIPREHWTFLEGLLLCWETEDHFFVHANYAPNLPLDGQVPSTALWLDLSDLPGPHYSGKTAIVGHTPQRDGKILDRDFVKCIDTHCGHGGLLTALDVTTGRVWQVSETGTASRASGPSKGN